MHWHRSRSCSAGKTSSRSPMGLFQRHHPRFNFLRLPPVSRRSRRPNARSTTRSPGRRPSRRDHPARSTTDGDLRSLVPKYAGPTLREYPPRLVALGSNRPSKEVLVIFLPGRAGAPHALVPGIPSVKRLSAAGMLRLAIFAVPVEVDPAASTFGSRRPPKARSRARSRPTAQCSDIQLVPAIADEHATTKSVSCRPQSVQMRAAGAEQRCGWRSPSSLRRGRAPGETRGGRAHRCLLLPHPRCRRSGQANMQSVPNANRANVTSRASLCLHDRQRWGRPHKRSPNLLPQTLTTRPRRRCKQRAPLARHRALLQRYIPRCAFAAPMAEAALVTHSARQRCCSLHIAVAFMYTVG